MKKIIDKITNRFRNNKEVNMYALCRNASGELSTYCSNENIK